MDDLIRYVQRAGVVSMLLIVGVLLSLIAPLRSEAQTRPVVKIQIGGTYNNNTANPLSNTGTSITVTEVAYNSVDCPAVSGYPAAPSSATAPGTKCFKLATGGTFTAPDGRVYTIGAYGAPHPRVLVADQAGNGALDIIALSNFEIKPVISQTSTTWWGSVANDTGVAAGIQCTPTVTSPANCGQGHTLYITIDHTFDRVPNPKTTGTSSMYPFSLRVSGVFNGIVPGVSGVRPTGPPGGTGSGNYVSLVGEGYFPTRTPLVKTPKPSNIVCDTTSPLNSNPTPNDTLYCPLQQTKGWSAGAPTSSFATGPNLEQRDTAVTPNYPTYTCNPSGTDCRPRIVQVLTVTMYGPDSLQLTNSWEGFGGVSCNLTSPDPGGGPAGNPAIPCHSNGNKNADAIMTKFLETVRTSDLTTFMTIGAHDTPSCQDANCPCGDPTVCKGTIVLTLRENPSVDGLQPFPFTGSGEGIDFPVILGPVNADGFASKTFPDLSTSGGPWSFTADLANWPAIVQKNGQSFNGQWKIDSIACSSLLNVPAVIDPATGQVITPEVKFSDWTTDDGNPKLNATVNRLGQGDVVTCDFHGHKNASN